jgi:CheY-like chemotaxis protein
VALIMVADDNAEIVVLLKDFLQSKGHQVVTVTDGMQMAEKAQDWRPQLIISDIQMPNVYGTSAYRVLQDNPVTKTTPLIFITGVDFTAAQKIVPKGPNVRLLPKPVDLKKLESCIQELLAPQSPPKAS